MDILCKELKSGVSPMGKSCSQPLDINELETSVYVIQEWVRSQEQLCLCKPNGVESGSPKTGDTDYYIVAGGESELLLLHHEKAP